jgi:hypothetical protein
MNVHFCTLLFASKTDLNPFSMKLLNIIMEVVRYHGKWFKITPKPYEPEKQSYSIAWSEPLVVREVAYKKYFQSLRNEAKVLYPSFRKEK